MDILPLLGAPPANQAFLLVPFFLKLPQFAEWLLDLVPGLVGGLLQLGSPDARQVERLPGCGQTAGCQQGLAPLHDAQVLHTEVPEEAGLLAQVPDDFVVDLLHFVEHRCLLCHVGEVVLRQGDVVLGELFLELGAHTLLVPFVSERIHTISVSCEPYTQQPF